MVNGIEPAYVDIQIHLNYLLENYRNLVMEVDPLDRICCYLVTGYPPELM